MQVFCLRELSELAPYADDWDRLSAGVPFRSWAWLSAWWRHYGPDSGGTARRARLFVLCAFDRNDRLLGLAPWYLDCCGPQGRVLRLLGSGEVCSDYLSVLCQPGTEDQVTQAMADYLTEIAHAETRNHRPWDLLELAGCDAEDLAVGRLIEHLGELGNTVHCLPGPNCWRLELPNSWDRYLAALSKSHRKQLRRLERNMSATGRAVLHSVGHVDELLHGMDILVDLHQRRHRALGRPGCFASARFTAFFREVLPRLLLGGQLQFYWLELDGKPAAAECQLVGNGVVYAYQAGVDPETLDHQPGKLLTMFIVRRAIEQGYRAFDFLRGDEPYKAHFRARPRPSLSVRVVPDRTSAQLRHNLWLAGNNVKQWIKSGFKVVGTRE